MAVSPSPEPPYNVTTQTVEHTQTNALSSSSSIETGNAGGKNRGQE